VALALCPSWPGRTFSLGFQDPSGLEEEGGVVDLEERSLAPVIPGRLLLEHLHGVVLRIDVETFLRPPVEATEGVQVVAHGLRLPLASLGQLLRPLADVGRFDGAGVARSSEVLHGHPKSVVEVDQVGLRRLSGELLLDEVIANQSIEPG